MRQGIDYAWHGPLDPDAWKAQGVSFVCRYLSHDPSKDIDAAEARLLSDAGLDIVLVWETTANRAGAGYEAGRADAAEALAKARLVGMPEDRPLYLAIDFDTRVGIVQPYFQGVRAALPLSRVGAYGGYNVIRDLFNAKLISWGWQTSAWSGGKWEPRAQLQQYRYDFAGGGVEQGDWNRAMADDFGQWSLRTEEDPLAGKIDTVQDEAAVEAARQVLAAHGVLSADPARHDAGDAASTGLVMIIAARLFSLIPEGVNLDEYELQLVKKAG